MMPCPACLRPLPAAALLLALAGPAVAAPTEALGRLFFTPERRAALERQRQMNIPETRQTVEGATLSVSGVVQRSSGRRTAWVNGTPQHDDSTASGVRVDIDRNDPARTRVSAGDEPPAQIKVGESINRTTRETTSGVGAGLIVTPSPAASRKKPQ